MPAAFSSCRPTVSPSAGRGGACGRSASVTWSAAHRRSAASLGTAGAASSMSEPVCRAAPSTSGATPRVHSRTSASSSRWRASSTPAQPSATTVSSPLIRSVVAASAASAPSAASARACASQAASSSVAAPVTAGVRAGRALAAVAVGPELSPSEAMMRPQPPAVAGCPSGPGSTATVYVSVAGSWWSVVALSVAHQFRAELRAPSAGMLPSTGLPPDGLPCGTTAMTSAYPSSFSRSGSLKTSSPNSAGGTGPCIRRPPASPSATYTKGLGRCWSAVQGAGSVPTGTSEPSGAYPSRVTTLWSNVPCGRDVPSSALPQASPSSSARSRSDPSAPCCSRW